MTYLACQREPLLAPLVSAAEQALSGAGALLFWAVEAKDGSLEGTEIVTPNSMMRQFENLLPLAPNWHRHSVRSHLLEQGGPPSLSMRCLVMRRWGQSSQTSTVVRR